MSAPGFGLGPDAVMAVPGRPRAHMWLRDGVPTLTVVTNARDGFSIDWPTNAGPLVIFGADFDVTITETST